MRNHVAFDSATVIWWNHHTVPRCQDPGTAPPFVCSPKRSLHSLAESVAPLPVERHEEAQVLLEEVRSKPCKACLLMHCKATWMDTRRSHSRGPGRQLYRQTSLRACDCLYTSHVFERTKRDEHSASFERLAQERGACVRFGFFISRSQVMSPSLPCRCRL